MAARAVTYRLSIPKGRSHEATSFLAQLNDQSRRLVNDLRGATAAELQWQPRRGANTIGMLLAHIAIVEVYWLQVATGAVSEPAIRKVLGIGGHDDGIPLAPGGAPPAALRGRTLAFYTKLLARARKHIATILCRYRDADLEQVVTRTRRNGEVTRQSVRWILYHVLEHEAGHYGQALLLRHLHRDRKKA